MGHKEKNLGKIHKFIETYVLPEKIFVLGNQPSRIFYGAEKILRKLKKAFFVQKTILPFMESVEAVLGAKEQDV